MFSDLVTKYIRFLSSILTRKQRIACSCATDERRDSFSYSLIYLRVLFTFTVPLMGPGAPSMMHPAQPMVPPQQYTVRPPAVPQVGVTTQGILYLE